MDGKSSRVEVGGYFSDTFSGDLGRVDKDGNDDVVALGAFVNHEALQHDEGSTEWTMRLSHRDFDGQVHRTTHSVADLHTSPKHVLRKLLSHGLKLVPGKGKHLIAFLLCVLPAMRFLRVLRSGWLENAWVYVQPNWVVGNPGEQVHLELEQNCPTIASMTSAGTLRDWKRKVAALLRGNPLAMFCVIFAFLGPLLKILGIEGGGLHLVGGSSVGKTTGLQGGCSVYGCGSSPAADSGHSYVQTWNQTTNGLEGLAAAHSDTLTALDEIGLHAGSDLGSDLYLLAGGRGKGAMDSHRRLKDVRSWHGNILSTGEMTIQEAIESKGGRAKAGMLVRLIDLPVTNMFPNPPEGMTSAEHSNLVKTRASQYYGTAGRAFVEFLVENLQEDPEFVIASFRSTLDKFTREMRPVVATPLQERAIRRFAAIRLAGHAAVEAGVLPYTLEEVDECVAEVLDSWLKFRPTVSDVQRSLAHLQDFLIRSGAALPAFSDTQTSNPKGFRDGPRGIFAFTDAQFAAATGSANVVEVAKELRRQKFLFCNETGRLKAKLKVSSGGESRLYGVNKSFITADLHKNDADESVSLGSDTADHDDEDI
jgi:putative DNA primase/helicase